MSVSITTGDFHIGAILKETAAATQANFLVYFGVALICVALPDALFGYLALDTQKGGSSSGIVSMIGQSLVQASVVYGVVAQVNGRRASFKECFNAAAALLLPLLGIGILSAFGMVVGLILFIVPGIILACMWAVTAAARVVEGPGVQRAFGRSVALTKGHRGSIFLLFLVFIVLLGLAYGAIYLVFGFGGPFLLEVVITPLVSAGASVVGAAGSAVLYLELRRLKEGVGPEALAAVFD